jgi:hypothetical protein
VRRARASPRPKLENALRDLLFAVTIHFFIVAAR